MPGTNVFLLNPYINNAWAAHRVPRWWDVLPVSHRDPMYRVVTPPHQQAAGHKAYLELAAVRGPVETRSEKSLADSPAVWPARWFGRPVLAYRGGYSQWAVAPLPVHAHHVDNSVRSEGLPAWWVLAPGVRRNQRARR